MSLDYPGEYEDDDVRNAVGIGEELFWNAREEFDMDPSLALALGLAEVWQDYAPRRD